MRRVATAVTYREPQLVRGVLIKVVKMISEEERGSSGYPLRWHPIPCGGCMSSLRLLWQRNWVVPRSPRPMVVRPGRGLFLI